MIQVQVKNYTTIKDASFDIQGLTVLRAVSNGGKSSVVNAIDAAVTSEFPPSALRWGESVAEVTLQFNDGAVRLTRNGGSTSYAFAPLNGQVESYSKLNRKLPDNVVSFLNLCNLTIGDQPYCVNFHKQFAPPLSLAMSHNRFVSFLSSSDLLEEHKSTGKKLTTKAYELQGSINSFSSLLSTTQDQLDAKHQQLQSLTTIGKVVDEKYQEVVRINNSLEVVASLKGKLDELRVLQEQKKCTDSEVLLIDSVLEKASSLISCTQKVSLLTQIDTDRSSLIGLISSKDSVSEELRLLNVVIASYDASLSANNRLLLLSGVACQLTEIGLLEAQKKGSDDLLSKLGVVFDKLDVVSTAEARVKSLSVISESITSLAEMVRSRDDKQRILDNDLCPMCSSPLGSHTH